MSRVVILKSPVSAVTEKEVTPAHWNQFMFIGDNDNLGYTRQLTYCILEQMVLNFIK